MRERYRHMMEHVTLDEEKREEIRGKMLEQRPARQSVRPLRAAMVAACVCLLLAGTVLAASPELRSLLWGSFEPYVEEVDPQVDPKAVGVYDGMEARIVSTVSDGYATVCHVEFRDLEGDRIAQLMERGLEAAQEELWQYRYTIWSHIRGSYTSTNGSFIAASMSGHRILAYEAETGVLTLEYSIIETVPAEAARKLELNIPIGFLRTYTDRGPEAGGTQDELFKWQLNASIQLLDTREVAIENVPVTLQNWEAYQEPLGEVDPPSPCRRPQCPRWL